MTHGPQPMHPSPLALEQLLVGQADPQTTAHVLACDACRARVAEMEQAAQGFSRSPRSLRAREAAVRADRQWKRRAVAFTAVPLALLALISAALFLQPREDAPKLAQSPATPKLRQGREVLEPRPGTWSPRLRSVSVRGRNVEFGQGSVEAAAADGSARPFTLTHTKVDVAVTGFMQAVTVTQTFHNPFSTPVEAVYVFPLPEDAAVHDLTLHAGERVIRAEVQKRAVARQKYEEAKAQGRRAALLDQERPNIFTQSLANLLPGERLEVTLQYVAPLRYDDGVYTLDFPMVVGPRYVPGAKLPGENQGTGVTDDTDVVSDASRISPPAARSGRDIEVHVRVDAGTIIEDLWSVSHRLEVDRPSSSTIDLSLHPLDTLPNKDLIVRWRVSGPQARAALLAGGGAFALMLNPEAKRDDARPTPKEMVFVIDTSGSMKGPPLAAAKRAMGLALEQMDPSDTFMLIDFANRASTFHDAPLPATADNVRRAKDYLQRLPAGGGTNQLLGIRRALAGPVDPSRVRMVLLMTDGFIGDEDEIFAETRALRGDARVFGFGIGSSVNHYLLSRLSEEGRGFYQYLRADEDPTVAIERFARRVRRPLITDVTVDWGGLPVADVLPAPVPDLFDAQPLIIQGRYREAAKGTVLLRGRRGAEPVVFEVPVSLPPPSTEGRALTMAWARARIERLSRVPTGDGMKALVSQLRGEKYDPEPPELVEQITALGLEYHLVTKYTSLVAVETSPVTSVPAVTVVEPTLQPDGVEPPPVVPVGQFNGMKGGGSVGLGSLGLEGVGAGGGGFGHGVGRSRGSEDPAKVAEPEDDFSQAFGGVSGKDCADPGVRAPPTGTPPKKLSAADVMQVVGNHRAEVAACVERQRRLDPALTGRLELSWVIERDGQVTGLRVVTPEFESTEVARCIMQAVRRWRFPPAGEKQTFTFPFKF